MSASIGKPPASEDTLLTRIKRTCSTPEFRAESIKSDRENKQSRHNIFAIRDTGISRAVLPRSHGGDEVSALELAQVMEEIASVDCSAATVWNMSISALQFFSLMPPFPRLTEVFHDARDRGAMMCGGISSPAAELDSSKGGFTFLDGGSDEFIVSGRGGFATGAETASYFFLIGARRPPNAKSGDRVTEVVAAFPNIADPGVTIVHNWDAMGHRATGSHDMQLDRWVARKRDCLVMPAEQFAEFARLIPQEVAHRRAKPFVGIMGCQIGSCRRALELLIEHLNKRRGHVSAPVAINDRTAEKHATANWAHGRLGRLETFLSTTRSALHEIARDLDTNGDRLRETQLAMVRALVHSKLMLEEFTLGITALSGAHGYVAQSPLNLALRDIVGYNAMVWRIDDLFQILGRGVLGEDIFLAGPGGT